MVLTRSQARVQSVSFIRTLDEVLEDCLKLNKIKVNFREINLGQIAPSTGGLIGSLDDAAAVRSRIEKLADSFILQVAEVEYEFSEEKARSVADFNDPVSIQEMYIEEKGRITIENCYLKSSLSRLKCKVRHADELTGSLEILITEKDKLITDLKLKIEEGHKQRAEL